MSNDEREVSHSLQTFNDKDSMPNNWEIAYRLNSNSADDAMQDADSDWYCNVLE
jgi:hypothetical protein